MEKIARAACLVHPSRREGYGLTVVEAASLGTPAVLVSGPDNAATELVESGVNGFVVADPSPESLASAIASVVRGGDALRQTTLDWYERHRDDLSIDGSLAAVQASYEGPGAVG
jgi:glycosyltransferase involved in cell wall biosynthesis